MADMAGGQAGWDQLAEGFALRDAVGSTDAVSAVEQAEANKGNNGVPWVGGDNAGGSGQGAIKVVGDVTRAGYNLLNGRNVTDTSSISSGACGNRLTCQTWASPGAAVEFATRVLGEREQRTCEDCTKTRTTPGVGLTPLIQEEYEAKLLALQELVTGAKPTTIENLEAAGSNSLPVTRGVIEALRDEPDQDVLGKRLASEAALSSVLEKALLLQRTLLTGRKEPNVAANELAVKAVDEENGILEQEIGNLKIELELRRTLAGNSALAILQRHGVRAAASSGVFEGDPARDHLREIEKPRSAP
jgi:integrating conjugative element protein (TIGR03755 family)